MITYTAEEQLRADMWNVAYAAKNDHRAWQNVSELAEVLYLVAREPAVRVVVEVGCAWGGTLYAWRNLTVAPWHMPRPAAPDVYGITMGHYADLGAEVHGAEVIDGDSHDPGTLADLTDRLAGRPVDVLFIDGDHSVEGTLADWRMYSPLVRPGGLVLLHDIRCAGEEAVAVAWEQIGAEARRAGGTTSEIVAKAGKPLGFGIVRMAGEATT